MTRAAAAFALLLVAACVPGEGPMMAPFQDCLGCHNSSGGEARAWTVAGTWRRGSKVSITDTNGKSFTLTGNDAGNFYTAEPLAFPVRVAVDGRTMQFWDPVGNATTDKLAYGGCNVCHHAETVTIGENMAPGVPCLTCHGPGGMAARKFSAAGTFGPQGTRVTIGGHSFTTPSTGAAGTTAVGNFFFYADSQPITFPTDATVSNRGTMSPAPSGDCNRCHGLGGDAGDD